LQPCLMCNLAIFNTSLIFLRRS